MPDQAVIPPQSEEPKSRVAVWIAVTLLLVVAASGVGYLVGVKRTTRLTPAAAPTINGMPLQVPTTRPSVTPSPVAVASPVPCPEDFRPTSPEEAAIGLYHSWVGNYDQAQVCARKVATAAVVDELLGSQSSRPDQVNGFSGCAVSDRDGIYPCYWAAGGRTALVMQVEKIQGGFVVVAVRRQ